VPLYEYVCRDCGAGFEKLVRRFGDDVDCPSCASPAVEKQLSVFAVASPAPVFEGCGGGPCGAGPCATGACRLPS
jgi:putative FmdB family regulatory protein